MSDEEGLDDLADLLDAEGSASDDETVGSETEWSGEEEDPEVEGLKEELKTQLPNTDFQQPDGKLLAALHLVSSIQQQLSAGNPGALSAVRTKLKFLCQLADQPKRQSARLQRKADDGPVAAGEALAGEAGGTRDGAAVGSAGGPSGSNGAARSPAPSPAGSPRAPAAGKSGKGGRRRRAANGTSRTVTVKHRRVTVRQIRLLQKRMGMAVRAHALSGRGKLSLWQHAVDDSGVAFKPITEPRELAERISSVTLEELVDKHGPKTTLEQVVTMEMQESLDCKIKVDVQEYTPLAMTAELQKLMGTKRFSAAMHRSTTKSLIAIIKRGREVLSDVGPKFDKYRRAGGGRPVTGDDAAAAGAVREPAVGAGPCHAVAGPGTAGEAGKVQQLVAFWDRDSSRRTKAHAAATAAATAAAARPVGHGCAPPPGGAMATAAASAADGGGGGGGAGGGGLRSPGGANGGGGNADGGDAPGPGAAAPPFTAAAAGTSHGGGGGTGGVGSGAELTGDDVWRLHVLLGDLVEGAADAFAGAEEDEDRTRLGDLCGQGLFAKELSRRYSGEAPPLPDVPDYKPPVFMREEDEERHEEEAVEAEATGDGTGGGGGGDGGGGIFEQFIQGLTQRPFADLMPDCISEALYNTLPDGPRRVWAYIFYKGADPKEVVFAFNPNAATDIKLTRQKLRCLASETWLNDEVINVYMLLLQGRDTRLRQEGLDGAIRCHFFNSFFFNKLYMDSGKYDYASVAAWTHPVRLQNALQVSPAPLLQNIDRIIIPVNLGNTHWTCVAVDPRQKVVRYYDSLGGENGELVGHLLQWLQDEASNKLNARWITRGWTTENLKFPRQINGTDCGAFAVAWADAHALGQETPYQQEHMEMIRVGILVNIMRKFIA